MLDRLTPALCATIDAVVHQPGIRKQSGNELEAKCDSLEEADGVTAMVNVIFSRKG